MTENNNVPAKKAVPDVQVNAPGDILSSHIYTWDPETKTSKVFPNPMWDGPVPELG